MQTLLRQRMDVLANEGTILGMDSVGKIAATQAKNPYRRNSIAFEIIIPCLNQTVMTHAMYMNLERLL